MRLNKNNFLDKFNNHNWNNEGRTGYYSSDRSKQQEEREQLKGSIVEFSSEQEKELIIEYLRMYAVRDQAVRDFENLRQPEYLTWTPLTTLDRLLTYRNGNKLSPKTVQAHRDFITQVTKDLLDEGESIDWIDRGRSRSVPVIDRGYSLECFPKVQRCIDLIRLRLNTRATEVQVEHCKTNLQDSESKYASRLQAFNDAFQEVSALSVKGEQS